MKYVALIFLLIASVSCSKGKELSQEERERTEPLAPNQIIEDEHGGLRFWVNTTASIELWVEGVPTEATVPGANYAIEVKNTQQNHEYLVVIKADRAGSMEVEVEGFTALSFSKRFTETISFQAGQQVIMKFHRGIVRYTFTKK